MKSKVEAGRRWWISTTPAAPVGWKIARCANLKRSRQQIQKTPGLQIPAWIYASTADHGIIAHKNHSTDPQCNGCPQNLYNEFQQSVDNFMWVWTS